MTITQARRTIEEQLDFEGPYSHNIISLCLQSIAKKFGNPTANKLIDECGLENLGWTKIRGKRHGI